SGFSRAWRTGPSGHSPDLSSATLNRQAESCGSNSLQSELGQREPGQVVTSGSCSQTGEPGPSSLASKMGNTGHGKTGRPHKEPDNDKGSVDYQIDWEVEPETPSVPRPSAWPASF